MAFFRRRSSMLAGNSLGGRRATRLSAPSWPIVLVSGVLALIAVLMRYAGIDVPIINARYLFELLLIAYIILVVGVLIGGRYGRY